MLMELPQNLLVRKSFPAPVADLVHPFSNAEYSVRPGAEPGFVVLPGHEKVSMESGEASRGVTTPKHAATIGERTTSKGSKFQREGELLSQWMFLTESRETHNLLNAGYRL